MSSPLISIDAHDVAAREPEPPHSESESETTRGPLKMSFVGIESRTRLTTSFGDVPAHLLRVNDCLRTSDGRFAKIRKIDVLKLDRDFLSFHPHAQPIRIGAGALAPGLPKQDVYLAPDQTLVVGTSAFEKRSVTAASQMSRPRVVRSPCEQVAYYRLTLDAEASVLSEKVLLRIEMPSRDA